MTTYEPITDKSFGYTFHQIGEHVYVCDPKAEIKETETGFVIHKSVWGESLGNKCQLVKVVGRDQKSPSHRPNYIIVADRNSCANIDGDSHATIDISDCSGRIIFSTDYYQPAIHNNKINAKIILR